MIWSKIMNLFFDYLIRNPGSLFWWSDLRIGQTWTRAGCMASGNRAPGLDITPRRIILVPTDGWLQTTKDICDLILRENKSSQVSLGKGLDYDHFSWRHSCISIDFIEGTTKLFENGRKIFEKYGVEDIQRAYEENKKEIDIISVGWVLCVAHFDIYCSPQVYS